MTKGFGDKISDEPARRVGGGQGPTVVTAVGATLRTTDGRELIDFSTASFGYGHEAVVSSVAAQMAVLPQSTRMFLNHPLADLVARMAELLPGRLSVTYPCNSATEASEGALKLALGYQRRSGLRTFVATTGSEHGHTLGAAAVSSPRSTAEVLASAPFHVRFTEFGDLAALQRAVRNSAPAGIIIEPIATALGLAVPDDEFALGVRQLCNQVGALMIVNESITGLGRTGRFLALDHHDVVPDVVILGGALGGGILPVGAYVTTGAINNRVYGNCGPWMHGSATGGNPLACAASLAALNVIVRDKLPEKCRDNGEVIKARLNAISAQYPALIEHTVAVGHLASIKWRSTAIAKVVAEDAMESGLILHSGRFSETWTGLRPPLTASRAEIDAGLSILDAVLVSVHGQGKLAV